ncbi:M23 family metallopeptidase [Natronospora cellulosivora (SeqCode)]
MKSKFKIIINIIIIIVIITTVITSQGFIKHNVEVGDTLISIATNYNIPIETLIEINNIENPDIIYVNQKIRIPKQNTYIVKKGDSLSVIARKLNVKLSELIDKNKLLNPDRIFVGQKLEIPIIDEKKDSESRERYQVASRSQNVNYIWPVLGRISSEYGWRIHPIRNNQDFHTGIDIAVPIGTPVYAAAAGIVELSAWSGGYGKLVIIRHRDESLTYYAHNHELLVNEGEIVQQGKIIAFSGNTGLATGPHLHFEIRKNNKHLDPLLYLNDDYRRESLRV